MAENRTNTCYSESMILEAFSNVLKAEFETTRLALPILQAWLKRHLARPFPNPNDPVHQVLVTELEWIEAGELSCVTARSHSGKILLDSLQDYCRSYEDWQYRRWLHALKASDFNKPSQQSP